MIRDALLFISGFLTGATFSFFVCRRASIQMRHIVGALLLLQMFVWSAFHLIRGSSEPSLYVFGLGAGGAMIFVPELGEFFKNLRK